MQFQHLQMQVCDFIAAQIENVCIFLSSPRTKLPTILWKACGNLMPVQIVIY